MSTPASTFTAGRVVIAAPDTTTSAPCPVGLDAATCGSIISGEAADLTDKVYGPGAPPILVERTMLPPPVQTLLTDCEGSSTCKFVAYDFDKSTGEKRDTRSHLISTATTTAHNAGVFVKDGVPKLPLFRTIPGYNFDGMFSFDPTKHTPLVEATSKVDERYCARACDDNPACGGFNYEPLSVKNCTLFRKSASLKNDVYKDGRVAFVREDIDKLAKGSDPVGTDLTGTGAWCGLQNLTQCNSDISDVITNNPEILSFTTSDIASCGSCPAKTVSRLDATRWAVTNEIDTTTISSTSADTITKLQYTTQTTTPPRTTLTPGSFYKITPYLPGMSFPTQTFLYMKRIKKFEVRDQNRFWTMSGTSYNIPLGTYLTAEFLVALNAAGAPGTFSFDGSKFTWVGQFVVIDIAGTLQLAGFIDRQEPAADQIDPTTGQVTMSGWSVSLDNVSGGFFTHGQYTQLYRADAGGMCEDLGNPANNGYAARGALPEMTARKTRLFGSLGADFTNMTVEYSPVPLEPIPVDYVVNGFLLLNPIKGRYTPASKWQRNVWDGDLGLTNRNDTSYNPRTEPRCSVVPKDTSYDVHSRTGSQSSENQYAYITNWSEPEFYEGCSRETGKPLPSKYTPQYNGFVFIITPATYSEFYNEATASVPDQPMLIKRPGEPVPYIFNPGTEEFRVLRFPSLSSFNTHLAANPSWGKYYSPYKSVGTLRAMTLKEAEDCGPPAVGGPGGSYAFEEVTVDPWPALTVYDENFWNTVPYDDRVEISDPTYGCADPDDPGAYIGGEYQKTVGKVTFCQLCPAGTYSPVSDKFATSCTPCAQGTYCPAGASAEQQCAAGYYCPTPALQTECPAGSYCPAGVSAHIPCVAGDYCPAKSIAKQDCPAGSYCPTPADKIECPAGSYCMQRVTAHTLCVDATRPGVAFYCPPGTRTLNECPAGFSCAGNSVATPCPAGNYCPTGSSAAITCPGNSTYVPLGLDNIIGISQLTQEQVLNQIFTQGSTCYTCPIVDGVQTTATTAKTGCECPVDSRNLKWRSWTNECLPNCPVGQSANAAKTGCENCGDNTYTPEEGLAKCIRCATNVPGAPAVHNADKSGCVCNGTVSNGRYDWNSKWNRCRLVCNAATHVAHAFTCHAKKVAASPIQLVAPDPIANYECPNGSENSGGQFSSTTICTKPSNKDPVTRGGCTTPGCFCNYSCPANWSNNGTLPFKSQYCTGINRSCYRKSIITSHSCPACWKPKYFSGGVCPPLYRSTPGTTDCSLPPTSVKDVSSLGIDTTQVGVSCQWAGYDDTRCGVCPVAPYRGYTGPTLDSSVTGAVRMICTMNSAPVSNDPWGADGASPMTDPVTGNILMPSLVSLTLASVQGPPAGDPARIPCLRGSYLATPVGSLTTIGSDGAVSGITSPIIPGEPLPGSCLPCPTGTFCDAGYAAPYPCPIGYYCPTPSSIVECTAGQICPAGQTKWSSCEAGYYCPTTNTSLVCPAGFFCTAGVTTPSRCNTGEYCASGSTRNEMCPAGSYCATPSEIAQCPAGSYCPAGTSVPRVCEAGNYCPAGSRVATPCTLGNYCDVRSSAQTPCDAGYYCPGPATRTACPAGTYNPTPGQSLSSACLECPAGTTCPYDGANTFSLQPNITPIRCATGYYCPAGSATYNACPVGWYCPTSSQKTQCPSGYVCPVGTITAGTATPRITIVSPGSESCRTVCARGTGLPQQWNGAICVSTNTPGTTCETINSLPVSCNCQQALGFGWIV